jgi:hypothetical protein
MVIWNRFPRHFLKKKKKIETFHLIRVESVDIYRTKVCNCIRTYSIRDLLAFSLRTDLNYLQNRLKYALIETQRRP